MTNEEQNPKVHHMTAKAARNALAGKRISRESYAAVLRDELSLEEARDLGRSRGPSGAPQPVSTLSKDDTTTSKLCLCGCSETLASGKRNFRQGHDTRVFRLCREHLLGERELTPEQLAYAEESGKLEKTRARLEAEEAERREKIATKSAKQREKEGKAEAKKQSGE